MSDIILETERLVFRPFTPADFDLLAELHSDPEVQRFMGGAWSPEDVRAHLEGFVREQALRGHSKWLASLKDGTFVGRAGVAHWPPTDEFELGYGLKPEFRGQGLASEAAAAVARWMFANTEVGYLIGFARPENLASRRVLEKIGMTFQGVADVGSSAPAALYRLERP